MARAHVLHLRPLSGVGPLRHLPFPPAPSQARSLSPDRPPFRIASGTCSPPSGLCTPHPRAGEVLRGLGGEGRGQGRAREAVRARSRRLRRPPVARGRPQRARPRRAVPPLARRVARRAPARRLPRIAWSARLAAPLPRPSILLQPPSREARAAPAAGGREGRDEKPARLRGVPREERAGGEARQGGLDRRVGGLPPPPAPPAGLGSTAAASDPEGGRA